MIALALERQFPQLLFQHLTNLIEPDHGSQRLFVTEQQGRILVFPKQQDISEAQVFLDISTQVADIGWEDGLLGLAFHPDFRRNGHFYVYYSAVDPQRAVLSRFTVSQANPDVADPQSEVILMEIPIYGNHYRGQLAFGPDRYLNR